MKNDNTNELIKQKAKALFFSYGLKSVSMDDIAKEIGISKRTIYQFFEDKNAIVSAVVNDLIQSHDQLFKTVHTTAKDAIYEVLKQDDGFSSICKGIRPRFLYELEHSFPDVWETFEQYKLKVHRYILDNLLRGKEEGLYREDLNSLLISDLRFQQLINLLKPEVLTSQKIGIKQLANEFTMLYLNAIATEKGKQLLDKYLTN